jgi:hypothetical protein
MHTPKNIKIEIYRAVQALIDDNSQVVADDTPLIGGESPLDSMKLIELCLFLEDKASDFGFEFDWTSDVAMSKTRSMFRTAGTLANEFINQMKTKK